ncbi:MAG: hypothetical protein IM526_02725 [Microcystis sp. M38BS1]|uniref:hypothetical protein n=1 Tax=Microcystis sp. M38BS1 TaxID=2771188 RepID=UPI0031FD4501|nr:hypothetical protein [Microcystis sp. M38BS1]MCA6582575.1 hypothetical protein [Pseudanabaena sp. M34BS1SP1A06MG]
MEGKTLAKYLASADATNSVVEDVYFNDVILLISGNAADNSRGLPFSRDYSKYQRHVKNYTGSNTESAISYGENGLVIPNSLNRILRAQELNLGQSISTTSPTYADVQLSGWEEGFSLGTANFTIEISFFTDNIVPIQTIFSVNTCLNSNVFNPSQLPALGATGGYGLFLVNSDLYFSAKGASFKINNSPIVTGTFYTVCIQRIGNTLQTFLNFLETHVSACSFNLAYSVANNIDTRDYRLFLGISPFFSSFGNQVTNLIDASFSGGISDFRITENIARYPSTFYSVTLPFSKSEIANRIDPNYSDTLFNFPLQFDAYNYASNLKRLANPTLRQNTPNFNTGFLELDGNTTYVSEQITTNLSTSTWTLELYLGLFENNAPLTTAKTLENWLVNNLSNTEGVEKVNLLKLTSNGKLVASIDFNFYADYAGQGSFARTAPYISFSVSEDGTTWRSFASETNNRVNPTYPTTNYFLPSSDIVFYHNASITSNITTSTTAIALPFSEPNTHFAVSREENNLYFYVNGVLVKTVAYSGTLYQESAKLELNFGSLYTPWVSSNASSKRSLGVKGLRVTNTARFVSTTVPNDYFYSHCLQPLPTTTGVLTHPKARILAIVPVINNPSISTGTCQWYVYVAQAFDSFVLADFSLTQIEGVSGASLVSLVKNNELEYVVTANTGTGNGKLTLNFVDRRTVKYKGTNTLISNYTGELSFTGQTYVINKNAPIPTITSGSSPYINEPFTCTLTWDAAIITFDITKVGVSNGVLSNLILINEITQTYQFNVTPEKQGVVYVQALEGAGVTDGAISSSKSNLLARVYAEAFPILQLPLDLSNTFYDVSPNQYQLDEIIPNNTLFSSTVFPIGTNSSLAVVPQLEQSGLTFDNFEAIGQGSSLVMNGDWTIEFHYRGNTFSPQNTTHLFSVEKAGTGFAVLAVNGNIQIVRSIDIPTNLFPSVILQESDIFSGSTPIYPAYENSTYTLQQKFPHFAITKKGNVYRFYRNGLRIGLVQSPTVINISSGALKVGYYKNRVTQAPYFLSSLRLTVGKALYTAYQHDVPLIPYSQVTNILDVSELLDYISLVSNNNVPNKAVNGNTLSLTFNSIIALTNLPVVTILGRAANVTNTQYNTYVATLLVNETVDQQVYFSIAIHDEPSLPNKDFSATTNGTSVFIENSPFTIVLATTQPNDNSFKLYATATLNKDAPAFSLASLTLTNCIVGGLTKASNNNVYTFEVQALTSGDFSLAVLANAVNSAIGTPNLASNTLTRAAVVPAYLPDPYYNNLLLFIQATTTGTIIDESLHDCVLAINNVSVVADTYPTGLLKSMKFDGQGSSIVANLSQPISANQDYCIEFYIYLPSLTTFSLSAPISSPASDVTPTSFNVNWSPVDGATGYVVDISQTSDFSRKIDGFDNKLVGDVNGISVTTNSALESPELAENRVKGTNGFVAEWSKMANALGYKVYTSLSSTFNTSIQAVSGMFTRSNNLVIGSPVDAIEYTPEPIVGDVTSSSSISYSSNSILQGILSSGSTSPKIFAFNDEASLRCYKGNPAYTQPAIAEIEAKQWFHLALVNSSATKSTKLYIDGIFTDKLNNNDMSWDAELNIGYAITNFSGYIQALRITYGAQRYQTNFEPPQLPLPKN